MNESDTRRLLAALELERARLGDQIANLQRSFTGIVDAAELTSTDDEHDPEGATIAYERAQASSLLQQARDDLLAVDEASDRIGNGTIETCRMCGGPIAFERLLALPGVSTCIRCAS